MEDVSKCQTSAIIVGLNSRNLIGDVKHCFCNIYGQICEVQYTLTLLGFVKACKEGNLDSVG